MRGTKDMSAQAKHGSGDGGEDHVITGFKDLKRAWWPVTLVLLAFLL